MKPLTVKERKKIVFDILTPYYTPKGFKKYLTGGDPGYVFYKDNYAISFFFNFPQYGNITPGRNLDVTFYEVEDYILKIQFPNTNLESYQDKKRNHIATIHSKIKGGHRDVIYTPEQAEQVAYDQIASFETEGKAFLDKYPSIVEVFFEMKRLRREEKYWHEILSGGGEHLFRGLIICKLCNDPEYDKEFEWVSQLINEDDMLDWQPYWEQYQELLASLEPKYNCNT